MGFAGEPYIACPLTTDYEAAKLFLDILDPYTMPVGGTKIGKAISKALEILVGKEKDKSLSQYKICLLITDGEDLGSEPVKSAELAKSMGVRIYTLGIGTKQGELIPVRDSVGNIIGYKKDEKGNFVVSKLDEPTLIEIANLTGGIYSYMDIMPIIKNIKDLKRLMHEQKYRTHYKERYQIPLAIGIVFILLGMFLPERKIIKTV